MAVWPRHNRYNAALASLVCLDCKTGLSCYENRRKGSSSCSGVHVFASELTTFRRDWNALTINLFDAAVMPDGGYRVSEQFLNGTSAHDRPFQCQGGYRGGTRQIEVALVVLYRWRGRSAISSELIVYLSHHHIFVYLKVDKRNSYILYKYTNNGNRKMVND